MVRLSFHPQAKIELREAAAYYQDKRDGLGEDFLEAARKIIDKIGSNPLRCGFVSPNYRCCRIPRFPYGIVYRVDGDESLRRCGDAFQAQAGLLEVEGAA